MQELTAACCEPVLRTVLAEEDAAVLAGAFKALSDPVRLRLFSLVANAPDGEACVCELTEPLDRSQPTVSHHVAVLVDAGLLHREQRGRWAYLHAVPERLAQLREALAPATAVGAGA